MTTLLILILGCINSEETPVGNVEIVDSEIEITYVEI